MDSGSILKLSVIFLLSKALYHDIKRYAAIIGRSARKPLFIGHDIPRYATICGVFSPSPQLEIVCWLIPNRGFESLSLRQNKRVHRQVSPFIFV